MVVLAVITAVIQSLSIGFSAQELIEGRIGSAVFIALIIAFGVIPTISGWLIEWVNKKIKK